MPALVAPALQQHHTTLAVFGAVDGLERLHLGGGKGSQQHGGQRDGGIEREVFEEVGHGHGHTAGFHCRIHRQLFFLGFLLKLGGLLLPFLGVGQLFLAQRHIVGIALVAQLYFAVQGVLGSGHLVVGQLLRLVGGIHLGLHPPVEGFLRLVEHAVECRSLVAVEVGPQYL